VSVDSVPGKTFAVSVELAGSRVVLAVRGEVDLLTAPELGAVVDSMIDRGHRLMTLDLAACSFMDASGLRVIAAAMARPGSTGDMLMVRSLSALVVGILDITGMTASPHLELVGPVRGLLGPEQETAALSRPVDAGAGLAGHLRQVTAFPADDDVVDGVLRLVVALARTTVGGAAGVSVSLRRHGQLATVAASEQTISDMDADQYATGEGPCVDASVKRRWFHAQDLETETRWPAFTPLAQTLGINAILPSPLIARDQPVGVLNIYSRTAVAFAQKDQELAAVFASEASTILTAAGPDVGDDEHARRFEIAQRTRQTIALAQGVIMERDGIDEDHAYTQLREFSQRSCRPLRERAEDVVAATHRFHDDRDAEPWSHDG